MVRVVVVFGSGDRPEPFIQGLLTCGLAVKGVPHSVSLEVLDELDPHCIVSIGVVDSSSLLWRMPLWRRRTWLNIPDTYVSPFAVSQSVLSLLVDAIEAGKYQDHPTVLVWDRFASQSGQRRSASFCSGTYENLEVHNGVGSGPDSFVAALSRARDGLLWVVDSSPSDFQDDPVPALVEKWRKSNSSGSVLIADSSDRCELLEGLGNSREPRIRHLLVDRTTFFARRASTRNLPLESFIGPIAEILIDPTTAISTDAQGSSFGGA